MSDSCIPLPIKITIDWLGSTHEMMSDIDIRMYRLLTPAQRDTLFVALAKDYFLSSAKIKWEIVE